MKTLLKSFMLAAVAILAAAVRAETTWTVTSATSGPTTTFTVTRDRSSTAETVLFRTMGLSAFAADGTALVLTPPVVNTAGFDFSLLTTDDLAGANPATFPLDPSGTNAVPASSSSVRFFRLKAAER